MIKKNKSLLIILLVLCIGLVGLTIAYFFKYVRLTLYLSSQVNIIDGNGSIDISYKLGL